jgi:hypothetical protein
MLISIGNSAISGARSTSFTVCDEGVNPCADHGGQVASERCEEVGGTVGYQIRLEGRQVAR